ncbi:MAG TPA: DUF3667 domain-containing protein [Steroidobacteraceae bacterium]|nr:DUF3667 domain-containing protein [Steroidobacteraceae bacterium]
MSGEIESAGDVLTGAIIANAVDGPGSPTQHGTHSNTCLNCGSVLTTSYCGRCGQSAHIHRSLSSLGHDILHGVFHFEGRFWNTLPLLFFFPGQLTRRYIDGERAKFVSPMALFLFAVFTMFAVFSLTTHSSEHLGSGIQKGWKTSIGNTIAATDKRIDALQDSLEEPDLAPEARKEIEAELADLQESQTVMQAMARGDLNPAAQDASRPSSPPRKSKSGISISDRGLVFNTGWNALDGWLNAGGEQLAHNPSLLIYKLKTTTYKYSWLLIPLSVPFMWLLFFWRRDIRAYDHAIFVSHSITFMTLFAALVALLAYVGTPAWAWGPLLAVVPPLHLYKHLRTTYRLSRAATWVRFFLLCIVCLVVLMIFTMFLLVLGAIG